MVDSPKGVTTPAQRFAVVSGTMIIFCALFSFIVFELASVGVIKDSAWTLVQANPTRVGLHFIFGMIWITSCAKFELSRRANLFIGMIFALLTFLGLFQLLGFLGVDGVANVSNFVDFISASFALYYGTLGARNPSVVIARQVNRLDDPTTLWWQ